MYSRTHARTELTAGKPSWVPAAKPTMAAGAATSASKRPRCCDGVKAPSVSEPAFEEYDSCTLDTEGWQFVAGAQSNTPRKPANS